MTGYKTSGPDPISAAPATPEIPAADASMHSAESECEVLVAHLTTYGDRLHDCVVTDARPAMTSISTRPPTGADRIPLYLPEFAAAPHAVYERMRETHRAPSPFPATR